MPNSRSDPAWRPPLAQGSRNVMLQLGHVYDRVDNQAPEGKYGEWLCRRCGATTLSIGPDDSLRNYAALRVSGLDYLESNGDFADYDEARSTDGSVPPKGAGA